jgi:hypothetical protein
MSIHGDHGRIDLLPAVARGWPSFLGVLTGTTAAALVISLPLVMRSASPMWPLLVFGNVMVAAALGGLGYALHALSLLSVAPLARSGEGRLAAIGSAVGVLTAGVPLTLLNYWAVGAAGSCAAVAIGGALSAAVTGRALLKASLRSGALRRFDRIVHCGICGHSLEGLASDRCAECGSLIPESVSAWRAMPAEERKAPPSS